MEYRDKSFWAEMESFDPAPNPEQKVEGEVDELAAYYNRDEWNYL